MTRTFLSKHEGLLASLPSQFDNAKPGRTLLIDGDGPLYAAAATVKTLPTAIRRAQTRILELMFLAQAQTAEVHLTSNTSHKAGRFYINAFQPYQGNRAGKAKPPLLEPLRDAMAMEENWLPEFTVELHHTVEADDGLIMSAYREREDGVIWSEDKDLRMTPYPYFDAESGIVLSSPGFGWTKVGQTPSGLLKPLGHGLRFFWFQMLMGDSADHIKGLNRLDGKKCGIVTADAYLRGIHEEADVANAVIAQYRKSNQNPVPEGYLLWLLRGPGDHVINYFRSVGLEPANLDFVESSFSDPSWYTTDNPPTPIASPLDHPEEYP